MSHTATISGIKITDISVLRKAIEELAASGIKISMEDGGTPRAFYPNQPGLGKADHVVKLVDSRYDIGLYKQDDGSYQPRTDFWGGDVQKILGVKASDPAKEDQAKLGRLVQMYGIHAAMDKARKQGYTVRRTMTEDGTAKLLVTGFN